jgi:hypothetical protein
MSDAILFYKLGWQAIWKQKIIFLYYEAFLFANQVSPYINYLQDKFLWLRCFLIPYPLLVVPVSLIAGSIGKIFISHKIIQSEPLLFDDIVQSIKTHFWRFTKLFLFIGFILAIPLLSGYFIQHWSKSFTSTLYVFLFLVISFLFTGLWLFTLAEFLIKNKGIFKSISSAWKMFSKHSSVLVTMGIISYGMWYVSNLIIVAIFEFVQPNFSFSTLIKINFLTPGSSLQQNLAYLSPTYLVSIFLRAFTDTSFMYAYSRYSLEERTGKTITRKLPR